jgi:pimeloyl-ACP methyl ester carboxylesterase
VYLPGFGDDTEPGYLANLRQTLAQRFNVAVLTLDYHAYYARLQQGATIVLHNDAKHTMHLAYRCAGLPLNVPLEQLGDCFTEPLILRGVFQPPHQEYQNFGVLQALDVAYALRYLHSVVQLPYNWQNVVVAGSSHGGYIAHFLAKLLPNTVRAVVDNSAYTETAMAYIGLAQYPEYISEQGSIRLYLNTISPWQLDDRARPGYFGLVPQLIRHLAWPQHVAQTAQQAQRLPEFWVVHSTEDTLIAPIAAKREQTKLYRAHGYTYHLHEVTQAEVDGHRFKTLRHGMQASMLTVCSDALSHLAQTPASPTTLDWEAPDSTPHYLCGPTRYQLQWPSNAEQGPQLQLVQG